MNLKMQTIDSIKQWVAQSPELLRLVSDAVSVMRNWNAEFLGHWHLFIALAEGQYDGASFETLLGLSGPVNWNEELEALVLREKTPPKSPPTQAYDVGSYLIYARADACFIGSSEIRREHVLLAFITRPMCIPANVFDSLGVDRRQVISRVVRERLNPQHPIAEQYYLGLLDHMTAMRDLYNEQAIKHIRPSG